MDPKSASACPACKAAVRPDDVFCAACGARLIPEGRPVAEEIRERPDEPLPTLRPERRDRDEDEDRPRRRRRDEEDDYDEDRPRFRRRDLRQPDPGLGVLLPVNQSALAILAGYAGLFSCFPVLGLVLGPLAIVLGILAIRSINRDPEQRQGGAYRAIIGIILGTVATLAHLVAVVAILTNGFK
jgi:hypothetical protein